ncbi:MAG: diguanylate cyclase [Candidatus Thiodiazotropha sp. (ex Epidulcina cf. delphinae)]|nr:diguanylate cyclase [Candidatus Thiodiazotropha sp. (ex Epidulcina cf. delphinae)]
MTDLISNTKELFKIRFLRNVLLVAVIGSLSISLVERFVIYPMFSSYLVSITEDDARRIARHLALDVDVESGALTVDSIPESFLYASDLLLETFGLRKLKIFSPAGETLFSTDSEDMGVINEKAYFHQSVAKGSIYTVVVQKEEMTAEDQVATADVVETYVPLMNPNGDFAGAFEIYLDITERWSALKDLMFWSALGMTMAIAMILLVLFIALTRAARITVERQKEQIKLQLAADVMANAEEGIIVTDADRRIESVNRAFFELTGYSAEEVIGKNPNFLHSGRHSKQFFISMWESIDRLGLWQGEIWNRRKDGEVFPEWLTITSIKNEKGEVANYVGMFLDISHFKVKESQLESLAYRDALTGLPNRLLVKDRLEQNLAMAKRGQSKSAVFFMDLDGFKAVNDSFGHHVGDILLQEVARRFKACIREEDTLGRLGGDEFIVCIRTIEGIREIKLIAKRLIDALAGDDLIIEGQPCSVSVSIGISIYPDDGEDAGTLIHCADLAMYAAKDSGKKRYCIYEPAMEEEASDIGSHDVDE